MTFDIEKRARELLWPGVADGYYTYEIMAKLVADTIQLAREAADARAESIAMLLLQRMAARGEIAMQAHDIARSTITKPKEQERYYHIGEYSRTYPAPKGFYRTEAQPKESKTREQVLEEALREIILARFEEPKDPIANNCVIFEGIRIARRALEWKPK